MIIQCQICQKFFDDEYRSTFCKHDTFLANDGHNNYKHYPASYLSDKAPHFTQSPKPEVFATDEHAFGSRKKL